MEVIEKTIKTIEKITLTEEEQKMLQEILEAVDKFTEDTCDIMMDDADVIDNLHELAYSGVLEILE